MYYADQQARETSPRIWVNEHNAICYGDIAIDDMDELKAIVEQAFNAGLLSGFKQGYERAKFEGPKH